MPAELTLDVPRTSQGSTLARNEVRDRLAGELAPAQLADLLLVVSELTTNAIEHGSGDIRLSVVISDDGRVRGEVVDDGSGFAHDVDERGIDDVGGRGLLIVAALAQRWGVHEGTSHIWFELTAHSDRAPANPQLGAERRPPQLD